MEHKKPDNDDLIPDDFDRLLQEKTTAWQELIKPQSTSEILNSQKTTQQLSDERVKKLIETDPSLQIAVKEPSANDAVDNSTPNTSSTETTDDVNPSASSDAPSAAELADNLPTTEDAKNLESNPEFTQSLLNGQMAQGKAKVLNVRGVHTGPWAKTQVVEETVSEDVILDRIGYPKLAEMFRRAVNHGHRLNNVESVTKQISRLQDVAFFTEYLSRGYRSVLEQLIETGSETVRKQAQDALAALGKRRESRVIPDGKGKKGKNGEVKPPKPAKLDANARKSIDILITLGLKQAQIIERFKTTQPHLINEAFTEYVKTNAKA